MISNINITDSNGNSFVVSNVVSAVQVSFDYDYTLYSPDVQYISALQYILYTADGLNWQKYNETDFTLQSHIFTDVNLNYSNVHGNIITATIEFLDSSGNLFINSATKLIPDPCLNANTCGGITNLSAFQRRDGSALVDIDYVYQGSSTINASNVSVQISTDNGATWGSAFTGGASSAFKGDIGAGILPGVNRIIWNPQITLSGLPRLSALRNVLVKLNLNDVDGKNNIGLNQAVAVINLNKPKVAVRKLSLKEEAV
jgi:hypothetical protein